MNPGHKTKRMLALFALATVIPLVLLVLLPLHIAKSEMSRQSTDAIADTTSNAADTMRLQLDSLKSLTASYAQRQDLITATVASAPPTNPSLRSAMREFQRANPAMKASLLMDETGRIITLEPYSFNAIGKDYSFRDYFNGAIGSDDTFVSSVFRSTATENPNYVAISHRIVDADGKPAGVLVAAVDSKAVFQSYVDQFKAENDVELRIFDQASQIVAAPGATDAIEVSRDVHILEAIAGNPWSGTMERDGRDVVTAYRSVPGTGWVISATVPRSAAFAPIDALQSRVVIIAAVLGSVVLGAIVTLAFAIRARDRAERRLRSSEMRTRAILDTANQMFCELDDDGRITDWNVQAEHMLGWSRDEAIGKSAIDLLVSEPKRERFQKALDELLAAGETGTRREREVTELVKKTSEMPLPVELSCWVTLSEGRRTINLFVYDISDRIRLQREQEVVVKRQRVLVEELRAADKAKSDFISTISHELRTPLTSITGYLEMLQDGLGGPLNENQQMMVDVVDRNSQRLLALIEDVLTLSRLESGTVKLNRTETDVRSLVNAAVETLLPQIHNNGLVLEVDVAHNCEKIMGDVDQLERVLINLLNNAVKFTPEGGRLSINAYRQDETVTISVSDTGVGIPVEEQPHLFSRFFRASTAQSHAAQGTGLGLTIVKSIVEQHGGAVTLQSAPGVGTTVYVELPVDVPASAQV
jgi:PAS domain S-box-containing protein